jgi:hypothetical protein
VFEWLTIDRAISLAALATSGLFSAIAAVYSIRNYCLAREARDEVTSTLMRSWLLSIYSQAIDDGWRLCQLVQRGEPPYRIVHIESIKPKRVLLAPHDPATYRPGQPGEFRPGKPEGISLTVFSSHWHPSSPTPQLPTLWFFIKISKTKSDIVSLRLTLEEMSASRRRKNIIVNSNPVDWSRSAAPKM